ncbi:trypsin-like peptidase domain-containing protein [Paraburkholderia bannensis]|uniref:trypsin-like peptidase domain-containing protein n=1 Tax=Paraburkholderia bannensis TaxID=765414 RepID=UPI002AB2D521|nr:trypsin-like peptidase domain-containing protein [Paraburkholderia bannensis]
MPRLIPACTSRPAAALAILIVGTACLTVHAAQAATPNPPAKTSQTAQASDPSEADKPVAEKHAVASPAAMATPDFFALADRYGPAVVHVIARSADDPQASPEQEAIDNDDPFSAFFKRTPRPPASAQAQAQAQAQMPGQAPSADGPRVMTGSGSGFIVSPDGVVLTTAHVVDNAQEVTVQLTDKREFKAEVVAVDPQSDVAVLQVNAHDLPSVKLGDSSKLRAGEPVLSIGSPDSFQNTVTTGIVSAASRTLPDGNAFPFFQTNVAVNPDNSGGPIFNRAGEVIGIAVQVYSDRDRYSGLTFGIPIDSANRFRAQLQAARKTGPANLGDQADQADAQNAAAPAPTRTFGMQVEDVSPGLAAALGLPHAGGALVDAVDADSIGAAAGVKAGDVIVQVGQEPVDSAATLASQLAAVPPATQTPLKVIRNRRPMLTRFSNAALDAKPARTAKATLKAARPAQAAQPAQVAEQADQADQADAAAATDAQEAAPSARSVATVTADSEGATVTRVSTAAKPPRPTAVRSSTDRLGLVSHALSEDERRSSGLPLGLMVDAASGPAARAGVRPGDIVLSLNDTLIETHDQAMALEAKATRSMALLIQRNNARSFVDVKLQ